MYILTIFGPRLDLMIKNGKLAYVDLTIDHISNSNMLTKKVRNAVCKIIVLEHYIYTIDHIF